MKKGNKALIIILIILLMGLTAFITLLLTGTIKINVKEGNSHGKEVTEEKNTGDGQTTINENMFDITYKEEVYSGIAESGNEVKSLRRTPSITSDKRREVAEKITDYLSKKSDEEWEEIKKMTDQVVSNNIPYQDMGVTLKYNMTSENKNRLSFASNRTGNFGGVGWDDESGYNFDATTGEILTLENIGIGVYDIVKEECLDYLKTTEPSLDTVNIDEWLNQERIWYFDFNKLIIAFPKYSLSSKIIKVPISKSKINDALDDKYKF